MVTVSGTVPDLGGLGKLLVLSPSALGQSQVQLSYLVPLDAECPGPSAGISISFTHTCKGGKHIYINICKCGCDICSCVYMHI